MSKKETELSLSLGDTIDKLAEKLGLGANAIIPEYTVLEKVRGIVWACGGVALMMIGIIAVSMLWPDAIAQADKYYTIGISEFKTQVYRDYCESIAASVLAGILFLLGGGAMILCNIERIVAPKAAAISSLIYQLKKQ